MKKAFLSCLTFLLILPAGYAKADIPLSEAMEMINACTSKCNEESNQYFSGITDYQKSAICFSICSECLTGECWQTEQLYKRAEASCSEQAIQIGLVDCVSREYEFEREECRNKLASKVRYCPQEIQNAQAKLDQCHSIEESRFNICSKQFLYEATDDINQLKSMTACAIKCEEDYPIVMLADRRNCIQKCGWTNK